MSKVPRVRCTSKVAGEGACADEGGGEGAGDGAVLMSTIASLPSVMKPRFIEPVGERTKLKKVMLASFVTLQTMAPRILLVCLHPAAT
jgi:hypothetical protein